MSWKRRFFYILLTVLLCWVISYACFTGCHLNDSPMLESGSESSTGGDSP